MAVAMAQLAQLAKLSKLVQLPTIPISKAARGGRDGKEAIEEEKDDEKNGACGKHDWPEVDGDSQVFVGVVELPGLLVHLGREKVPNRHLEILRSASASPQPAACKSVDLKEII